jgi:putative OPT family oligopeptide transporter
MNSQDDFKPYIPASKVTPELTVKSVVMGILLSVVFGAANAYLGLRVGLTVSASIPAAVIAMGMIRIIMRRNSILESNMIQTIGSAGESLAGGAIFILPALFLLASEGAADKPSIADITVIAFVGGLLGVFFMIPLRNALIVKEHGTLPYPEGTACAEVLLAGEGSGDGASKVFSGMGIAAFFKLVIDGLKAVPGEIVVALKGFGGQIGTQIYPAVMSVGYICGPRIASYMFAGGILSWLVLIPLIVIFGSQTQLYPAEETIQAVYAANGASGIWSTYIRYIGAGALAAGGIISLVKSLPLIVRTFSDTIKSVSSAKGDSLLRTHRDINIKLTAVFIAVLTIVLWLAPAVPLSIIGAAAVVVFAFFFAAVSSRMAGLVGSSNNPVSGMAIAALLISSVVLKLRGISDGQGMKSAISIGAVICIAAAIASDTSQDLKTGFLLGATPKKQQIGEIIGVSASALAIGGTLYLLDSAWGFGSEELAAPQATLMKMIADGVMSASLPWGLVFTGVFIAVFIEILGIPVLPFAIGVYLPINLSACVMSGGLVRLAIGRLKRSGNEIKRAENNGILFCSGMIAGEGLAGVFLALAAVMGFGGAIDISGLLKLSSAGETLLSAVVFVMITASIFIFSIKKSK